MPNALSIRNLPFTQTLLLYQELIRGRVPVVGALEVPSGQCGVAFVELPARPGHVETGLLHCGDLAVDARTDPLHRAADEQHEFQAAHGSHSSCPPTASEAKCRV